MDLRGDPTSSNAPVERRDLSQLEAERSRLATEVAVARARLDDVNLRLAARAEASQRALGELLGAARSELAVLEREHEAAVASIRTSARAEATRIVDHARGGAHLPRSGVSPTPPGPDAE